jgi:hypothetical protein
LRETLKDVKQKIVLYKKLKTKKLLKSSIIPLNKMEKVCSKCGVSKSVEGFGKSKDTKDGFRYDCNDCRIEYRKSASAKIKAKNKSYYEKNKNTLLEKSKEYRDVNKDVINQQRKEYRNREQVQQHIKKKQKEYLPIRKAKTKERRKTDINFKMSEILRSKIHKMLHNRKTSYSNYIGCDLEWLKKWLEYRFDDNMNWENFGSYWQIDHILPIHGFNLQNDNEVRICFNWTNLQPLSALENRQKSDTLHPHYYFNNIINVNRFNSKYKQFLGYQTLIESLRWLRIKLRYGKNSTYDSVKTEEIGNPQPSL